MTGCSVGASIALCLALFDLSGALRCWSGYETKLLGMKHLEEKECAGACMRIDGEASIHLGFTSGDSEVVYRGCHTVDECRSQTCSSLQRLLRHVPLTSIRSCDIACCTTDGCNAQQAKDIEPQTTKNMVSTSFPTTTGSVSTAESSARSNNESATKGIISVSTPPQFPFTFAESTTNEISVPSTATSLLTRVGKIVSAGHSRSVNDETAITKAAKATSNPLVFTSEVTLPATASSFSIPFAATFHNDPFREPEPEKFKSDLHSTMYSSTTPCSSSWIKPQKGLLAIAIMLAVALSRNVNHRLL